MWQDGKTVLSNHQPQCASIVPPAVEGSHIVNGLQCAQRPQRYRVVWVFHLSESNAAANGKLLL